MKSGGGNPQPPADAQPQSPITPYGQASPFNPQYQSFLPMDGSTAMLNDPSRMEGGLLTPLQTQQEGLIAAQQAAAALAPIQNKLSPREQFLQLLAAEQNAKRRGSNDRGNYGTSGREGYSPGGRGGFGRSTANHDVGMGGKGKY